MSSNTFRCCSKFQYFSLTIVINTLANAILVQSPHSIFIIAFNDKNYLLWKNQLEVFLAEVVNFHVCRHQFFGHV